MAELTAPATHPALAWAHPVVQEWFLTKFGSPTEPQIAGWPAILRGDPTLISAPTGSGKTLAAFLACIDRLFRASIAGTLAPCTHVLYISPLKALSNDVQKNLDAPLAEIQQLALQRGYLGTEIRTGVRTGDTLTKHRAAQLKHPPHILVTTPESLYILLTAGKSRQNLTRVHTVIVDEIHALAPNKRGAHLALSLERLDALVCGENPLAPGTFTTGRATPPQRIGLSATQNPIELVANFLTGTSSLNCHPERSEGPASCPERHDNGCHIHTDGPIVGTAGEEPPSPRENARCHPPTPSTSHLAPSPSPATIIQIGNRRTLNLAIEVPSTELGSLTTTAMWQEIFDKLALLAEQHRSTLVFVNTRRLVEKIAFELSERLAPTLGADAVAAHHGSLSRLMRLDAEQRLKSGECRILIATASLELGIDIGNIDLVCQIATTRSISTAMQRVGRAGHWRGATPKGRFFATTRDDLLEQAALLRNMTAGELDQLTVPDSPTDVLMQQIVAAVGAESWDETALFHVLRRAYPYRNLTRTHFDELLALLHNGIESSRGRYGAYLLRDQVHGHLHSRRGARSIAISNGGAIPDTSIFAVMLQPENVQIATLDEHFAVDSSPGDVVLLGNTSWRIQRVDPQGKVLVEDAHGAPPSIPFWEGEAPQRTGVLSTAVSDLRAELDHRTSNISPRDLLSLNSAGAPHLASEMWDGSATASSTDPLPNSVISTDQREWRDPCISPEEPTPPDAPGAPHLASEMWDGTTTASSTDPQSQLHNTLHFLQTHCFLNPSAALQLITYIVHGRAALGAVPTKTTIIAERFFDEGGGQQLILHAPFGGRINKAWGLALRKRFCRGFNFELQAAATDNGINISLAEQHSFPLADVFHFLTTLTARELLEQACIPSPLFKNRWRWAAGRSLQLLRMSKGKRIAPQIQRTRSDDLLASVFPHASACPETMTGDIVIPQHPLVDEVMKDTLTEAMDIDGLLQVLADIAAGTIRCLAIDTPVPSVFAHELVHAMPYAFLDDEDAAARRTRAVALRRGLPDAVTEGAGILDPAAIATVRQQLTPDIRDEHELHDLLLQLTVLHASLVLKGTGFSPSGGSRGRPGSPTVSFSPDGVVQAPEADSQIPGALAPGHQAMNCHPDPELAGSEGPALKEAALRPYGGSRGLQAPEMIVRKEGALAPGLPFFGDQTTRHWPHLFTRLAAQGRAHEITLHDQPFWIATERLPAAALLWPSENSVISTGAQSAERRDPCISPAEPTLPAPTRDPANPLSRRHPEAHPKDPCILPAEPTQPAPTCDPANPLSGRHPEAQPKDPCILPAAPLQPEGTTRDAATTSLVQGWLQLLGPTTAAHLAALVHLHPRSIHQSLLAMELQGLALRGVFEGPPATPLEGARLQPCQSPHAAEVDAPTPPNPDYAIEWCERRILHRIHRLTLGTLRKSVEPVSAAVFMRWLLDWHHLAPATQPTGEEAVLAAIEQLEGFEAPAIEWERTLLPARIAVYNPQWLDNLCLAGVLAWARVSPHPAFTNGLKGTGFSPSVIGQVEKTGALAPEAKPRRVIPTSAAPITFYLRESADWLHHALAAKSIDPTVLQHSLSPEAQTLRALLAQQGAAFTADLQRLSGLTKLQTTTALWELATAGLASADGFDQLRSLLDPRRKSAAAAPATSLRKRAAARTTAGRWSLLSFSEGAGGFSPLKERAEERGFSPGPLAGNQTRHTTGAPSIPTAPSSGWVGSHDASPLESRLSPLASQIAAAKSQTAALESHARILLTRYGVLFRELLTRESNAPAWRDLVPVLRRLEARGELRGGRFVAGPFGEQFALPEAADALRKARSHHASRAGEPPIPVAAADPLNLAGILVPGDRTPAIPGRTVLFQNGAVLHDETAPAPPPPAPKPRRSMADLLRAESLAPRPTAPPQPQGLFS